MKKILSFALGKGLKSCTSEEYGSLWVLSAAATSGSLFLGFKRVKTVAMFSVPG
jgi:hypothetical protein